VEQISGYSVIISKASVEQITTKPFFGDAHVKFGQCHFLWGYLFQIGGVLGAKYSHRLDTFGPAFMGARGAPGAVEKYCSLLGAELISQFPLDTMTFSDFVIKEYLSRIKCKDDPTTYLIQHLKDKFLPENCQSLAREYAMQGAAIGAIYPAIIREMYSRTHGEVRDKRWQEARRAGLDIPEQQSRMSYQECEEMEDQEFMEYCRTCCPTLYATLQR
jgi:hypothetical protein